MITNLADFSDRLLKKKTNTSFDSSYNYQKQSYLKRRKALKGPGRQVAKMSECEMDMPFIFCCHSILID